jgi:hypothetical protein
MTVSCRVEATKAATMTDADVCNELRKALNQMVDTFDTDHEGIWQILVPEGGVAIESIIRSNAPLGEFRYHLAVWSELETEPQESGNPTNQQ